MQDCGEAAVTVAVATAVAVAAVVAVAVAVAVAAAVALRCVASGVGECRVVLRWLKM